MRKRPTRKRPYFKMESAMTVILRDASEKCIMGYYSILLWFNNVDAWDLKLLLLLLAGLPCTQVRMGQSLILIEYGQPLFVWLSRDWPSVRTYASTDCTGGVGETIKRKGGVSQVCLGKSTSFLLHIHNMVNWQLSKQDSHWPLPHDYIAGSCVISSRWRDLFGSCPLTS